MDATQANPNLENQNLKIQKPKGKPSLFKKIASVAILLFMVGWVFAAYYGLQSTAADNKQNQNIISAGGYDFYLLPDNTFGTYVNSGDQKIPVAFRLDPREAGNISLEEQAIQQILTAKKIYIAFDPQQPKEDLPKMAVAAAEISRITGLYNLQTVGAFTRDSDPVNQNVPIKTCKDVDIGVTVIEMQIDNSTEQNSILQDKGCVKVIAKSSDGLILAADKLGMNLIGIKL